MPPASCWEPSKSPGHLQGLWSSSDLNLGTDAKDAYRIRTTGSGDGEIIGILGNSPRRRAVWRGPRAAPDAHDEVSLDWTGQHLGRCRTGLLR